MPDIQIVLAHAGGYKALEAFLAVKAHPALHVDVSFTPMYFRGASVEQDLEFLVRDRRLDVSSTAAIIRRCPCDRTSMR